MEKFYYRMKEPVTRGLLLLLLLFVGMTANATDFTEVELGTDYQVAFCTNWYGKWTAPSDGTLFVKESKNADYITVYSDEALTTKVDESALNGTKSLELAVTSGTTYYFKTAGNNFGTSVITFTFEGTGQETIGLESVSPEAGSTLSVTGNGKVSLTFDRAVSIDGATITSGTNSAQLAVNVTNQFYAGCDFKSTLFDWLQSGAVKEGDDVVITFKGITMAENSSVKYGTDGTLTLTYKAPKAPVTLVSIAKPETFKTVWTAGDEDGKVVFTFSDNISSAADDAPVAYISFGNLDKDGEGHYYYESITPTISGNTVTFDLTGKDRSSEMASVLSGLSDTEKQESYYTRWAVQLKGVKDTEGNFVYSDAQGSIGSFSAVIPVDESTTATEIVSEFTPASGESLESVDNIEIYIEQAEAISSYNGVKFEWVDSDDATQEVVVAKADITEMTEDGALILTVPVPAAAQKGTDVVVTFDGLVYASGFSGDITATYNTVVPFSVTMVNPTSTTWATLDAGTIITVKPTHFDEIGYMRYAIYDAESGECIKSYSENMEKNETAQTVSYEVFGDYTLYEGHTYNVIFDAWPTEADKRKNQNHIGTDTIQIAGASEEFKFSTVKYVSIDPAMSDDYVIASVDQNVFTVTFDGPVTLDKTITALGAESGTTVAFQSITAKSDDAETVDGKTYSKVWELVAPESFLEDSPTAIGFSVKAYDKDGLLVEGNTGEKAGSYLYFEYACSVGAPDFTILPAAGTVYGKLATFNVSYSGGISLSYLKRLSSAVLLNADGDTVTTVKSAEQIIPDEYANSYSYNPTTIKVVLNDEIEASLETKEYTLSFPHQYFSLGSDQTAAFSKATTFKYTLSIVPTTVSKTLEPVSVDPEDGSTVNKIEAVKLTFDQDVVVNTQVNTPAMIYIPGDSGSSSTYFASVHSDPLDTKSVYVDLDNAITKAGTYTVEIASGAIGDSEYETSGYTSGTCNGQLFYKYTVSSNVEETNVTIDPAEGTVASLSKFTLVWPDFDEVGESFSTEEAIELKDAEGNVVATGSVDYDWDNMNTIFVNLDTEVTAEGTYTLVIPQDYFILIDEDWNETNDSGHTFTYTISASAGDVVTSVSPEDGATVSKLETIILEWPNETLVSSNFRETVPVTLTDAEGETVATASISPAEEGNQVYVIFEPAITAEGTYTLNLPAKAFLLGSDLETESAAHTFTYTVKEEVVNSVSPEDGATVSKLETIILEWPNEELVYSNYREEVPVTLQDAEGNTVATATISTGEEANQVYVIFDEPITAEGTYTLVLPEKAFLLGTSLDRESAAHSFTYTVKAEVVNSISPADGATVESIETIVLEWPNEELVYSNYRDEVPVTLQDAEGNTVATATISTGEEANQVYVIFEPAITAEGTYTLVLPEGAFLLGTSLDRESAAHTFTYTIAATTGINGIHADANGMYNVYTVSGMRVMSTTNGAALKSLKRGLYIINGKTVAVK